MSTLEPGSAKDGSAHRETEGGWLGACDRFALTAAPTWFNWLEWVFVLGALDYLAAKSGAWLAHLAAAVALGLLWMYFNAFFVRLQLKGWFGVHSAGPERALATVASSVLAGGFWFAAQVIAETIATSTK
ncbi:MAG: hypothetical protein H0X40_17095 [Chthoniobacterales bacterium]|nr:hypothetical protein [Chthoniobacterales bacterium]